MKAFLITVALAFSTANFAANDAQAGVSFQFGYGGGYYGHGYHSEYGYRHYGYGAMSLSLLKFVGQASLVDEAMLPS